MRVWERFLPLSLSPLSSDRSRAIIICAEREADLLWRTSGNNPMENRIASETPLPYSSMSLVVEGGARRTAGSALLLDTTKQSSVR